MILHKDYRTESGLKRGKEEEGPGDLDFEKKRGGGKGS